LLVLLYFIVYNILCCHIIIIICNIGGSYYTHAHQPVRESDEQFSLNYPIRQVRENSNVADIQMDGTHAIWIMGDMYFVFTAGLCGGKKQNRYTSLAAAAIFSSPASHIIYFVCIHNNIPPWNVLTTAVVESGSERKPWKKFCFWKLFIIILCICIFTCKSDSRGCVVWDGTVPLLPLHRSRPP